MGGSENGLILKPSDSRPTLTYDPPNRCVRLSKLPPRSKMNVYGVVLLKVRDEEIQKERFARAGAPEDHGVGHIPVMEVQEVGRVVVRFENRQIFLPKMPVARLATVEGEQEREIGVIRVQLER